MARPLRNVAGESRNPCVYGAWEAGGTSGAVLSFYQPAFKPRLPGGLEAPLSHLEDKPQQLFFVGSFWLRR